MTAPFDPYLQWLGIEGEGIPSHYELLGLRLKEPDVTVIRKAANARVARLRAINPGPRREIWEQLITYLEQVAAVLSDPGAKAEYDATLPDPPPVSLGPIPSPPPTAGPTPPPKVRQDPQPTAPPGMAYEPSPVPPPGASSPPDAPPVVAPTDPPTGLPVGIPLEPLGIPVGTPIAEPVSDSEGEGGFEGIGVAVSNGGSGTSRPLRPRKRGLSNAQLTALFVIAILVFGGLAFGLLKIRERDLAKRGSSPTATTPTGTDGSGAAEGQPPEVPGNSREKQTDPPDEKGNDQTPEKTPAGGTPKDPRKDPPEPDGRTPEPPLGPEGPPPEMPGKSRETGTETDTEFQSLLGEARRCLGVRDLDGASSALKEARKAADTPKRHAEWDQVCSMQELVQAFWSAIREELDRHKNEPMTISYAGGSAQFVVVECDRNRLVIRKEGQTVTYAVKEMPHNLVLLMARNLLEQNADAAAMTGAFIAMEPDGDRKDARRLLEEAAEARDDVKRVLPELDVPRAAKPTETRLPIPDDKEKLAKAQHEVKKEMGEAYDAARSGPKQIALSETLVKAGIAETTDRLRQYVLFDDAIRYAVAGGSAGHALRAVDAMSRVFAVDALEKKTAALTAVARNAVGSRRHRDLVPLALELAREAAKAGRKNQLERLIVIAKNSAREAKSANMMKEVMDFERGAKKG